MIKLRLLRSRLLVKKFFPTKLESKTAVYLLSLLFLVLCYVHFWLFSFQHGAKDGCATLLSVSFFLVFCYVLFLDPFHLFIPQGSLSY